VTNAAIGALLAAAVALVAYRARALTAGGAGAAFVVGASVFAATGWRGALVLFAFFIPSTLLSRLGRARKRALDDVGKQGPRDAWQVLANGGVAALCAVLMPHGDLVFAAAFSGAFAAAAADTWGTEIGTLSRAAPRSVLTLRPVATGMSGGITLTGSLATIAGAAFVAAVAWFAGVAAFWPVALGGIAGAFLDSLAGATLQAQRWCPQCARACETDPHRCGSATILRRGFGWVQNDAVNLIATLAGALAAGSMATLGTMP
jgi:uncharacterized protein (TIGR00297 family)